MDQSAVPPFFCQGLEMVDLLSQMRLLSLLINGCGREAGHGVEKCPRPHVPM
jgi:hypothetical protein